MFNRRLFVALAVCLAVSASSAFANGNGGGTKKDSTLKVQNESQDTIFAFTNVSATAIQNAVNASDPIKALQDLGGKQIESGGQASFSVRAGAQKVTVIDVDQGVPVFVDRQITVNKGQTRTVFVHDSDIPTDNSGGT